jgi:hypothetical protein
MLLVYLLESHVDLAMIFWVFKDNLEIGMMKKIGGHKGCESENGQGMTFRAIQVLHITLIILLHVSMFLCYE